METQNLLINYRWREDLLNDQEIKKNLQQGRNLVIIKDFPLDDEELETFISRLGIAVHERRNNKGKAVFDVKIARLNNFFTSIANSNLEFPLHTDCADFDVIPNVIGLLCAEPADHNEGTSKFMFLHTLLDHLPQDEVQKLSEKKWKFRNRQRSILQIENGRYTICYDRITMESFSKLNPDEIEELNKLDALFNRFSFSIKLEKGDLILFRNDLLLHGREKIDINSQRLLKRIRFSIANFS